MIGFKYGFLTLGLITLCFARLPAVKHNIEGNLRLRNPSITDGHSTLIAPVGDIRGVLGCAGKNITVCQHGSDVTVIYGDPTTDPNNPMEVKVAYSTDSGSTWLNHGPFSPELQRIYPGTDGSPDFCIYPEQLWFVWQEKPSSYAPSDLRVLKWAGNYTQLPTPHYYNLWLPCIVVPNSDPLNIIAGAWSYFSYNATGWYYVWVSVNGGETWSDTIPVVFIDPGHGTAGHFRSGASDYLFMTYHNGFVFGNDTLEWPYIIESTDGGYTWGPETPLPVPYANPDWSQFWWHELDCEVILNEPWAIHTDLGIDSMWLFHGTGTPGNWDWQIFNVRQLGACSLTVADTLFYCYPSQYPNISYEPISNTILISYKAYFLKATAADTFYNGAHIGGIYSTDNGITWHISQPLSDANTGQIPWNNMVATEVAHRLVNINGEVYSYGIWANQTELNLYFDRGHVTRFYTGTTENYTDIPLSTNFKITPTISRGIYNATFYLNKPGQVNIDLFDACGRLVEHVFDGYMQAGIYTRAFMYRNIADGPYFLVLNTSDHREVIKAIFTK